MLIVRMYWLLQVCDILNMKLHVTRRDGLGRLDAYGPSWKVLAQDEPPFQGFHLALEEA